jgi:hypothetical protein
MKPGNAVGPRPPTKDKSAAQIQAEKILASLGYGPEHLIKFQQHWNYVVASGMISGAPLVTDSAWGPKTRAALNAAHAFMSGKPKDWMYYVHKAIQIGPQSKPKPTYGGGLKTATKKPTLSRRRRGRR